MLTGVVASPGAEPGAGSDESLPVYRLADMLADPLAPRRLSVAATWGDAAITLDIPGGPYAFCGLNTASQSAALQRFEPAVSVLPAFAAGAIRTTVRRVEPGVFRPPVDPRYVFELAQSSGPDGVDLAGWRLVGRLELGDPIRGSLGVACAEDLLRMGDLENYLRFLVAHRLLALGGLLMHSACVVHRGWAYLFVGRSGAGKTTVASLALEAGLTVLSDDMNALIRGIRASEPPRAYKLPFAGTLGQRITQSGDHPLRAICWLDKGDRLGVTSLRGAKAVAHLAACAPYVNGDPFRVGRLLQTLEHFVAILPTVVLTFPRGVDAVRAIEEVDKHVARVG